MNCRCKSGPAIAAAVIAGAFLVLACGNAFAQPETHRAKWITEPVEYSKGAGIRNNQVVLGPADAEIVPHEGNLFLQVSLRLSNVDETARTDLVASCYLKDGKARRHKSIAILHEKAWRPIGLLDKGFRIIRASETVDILFEIPRAAPVPYTLVLGEHKLATLDKYSGPMPQTPSPAPPRAMWSIFDGFKLRSSPSPSAECEHRLHAGEEVQMVRERRDCYFVKSKDGEGWVHKMALVDSRSTADQALSHDPKPNSLFIATHFSGPSTFELQIWHGDLQVTPGGTKPHLERGDCVAISNVSPGDYQGPVSVFGHSLDSNEPNVLYILRNDKSLTPLFRTSPHRDWPIILGIGGACAVIAASGLFVMLRSRRISRSQVSPIMGMDRVANADSRPDEAAVSVSHKPLVLTKEPSAASAERPTVERIRFKCPKCSKAIAVPAEYAGKRGKCPACGSVAVVPPPASESPDPNGTHPALDSDRHHGVAQKKSSSHANYSSQQTVQVSASNAATAAGDAQHEVPGSARETAQPAVSTWGQTAGAGAACGAVAGMIASYGSGKLGMAGFAIFLFLMMGINGGSRRFVSAAIFTVVAAGVAVLFQR